MTAKTHKAYCLITDAEKERLLAEAKKAKMSVADLLKSRIFPTDTKPNQAGFTMQWECPQVTLIVRSLDYETWKLLVGVVQVAEPDKPKGTTLKKRAAK